MFPNIQVCVHLAAGAFPIMIIAATVAFFREEERTMSSIVWVMIMLFSLMTVPAIMRDRGT